MSELVEKVAIAIARVPDGLVAPSWHPEARAAIKAVAEWSMSNYYAETSILRFWTEVLAKLEEPGLDSEADAGGDGGYADPDSLILVARAALEAHPRSVCSCVIEMATFRVKGEVCPHCGGVIG